MALLQCGQRCLFTIEVSGPPDRKEGGNRGKRQHPSIPEHTEYDFIDSSSDPGLPRGCALLLCSKSSRGVDATSPKGLAALAGLRAFGIGIVAGLAENLANTHTNSICGVCPL